MAIKNAKEFIEKARKQGIPDEETYKYLQSQGIINPQPTTAQNIGQGAIGFAKSLGRSVVGLGKMMIESPTGPLGIMGAASGLSKKVSDTISAPYDKILEPTNQAQKIGGYAETAAEFLLPMGGAVKTTGRGLIKLAEETYLKALKPSTSLPLAERLNLARTGLKEGIQLTQGGVEKMADKIVSLETELGDVIKKAGGKTINVSDLKPYVNSAKKFLGETVDVKGSESAIKEIESVYKNFASKYGKTIDTAKAQELKTNTYQVLKKYYEKMSAPAIEASKNLARGLKEEILKNAPEVGDINQRLSNLYKFETVLEKAQARIQNSNVVSLGAKVLLSGGKPTHWLLALVDEMLGPKGKSIGAMGLNKIGTIFEKLTPEESNFIKGLIKAGYIGGVGATGKTYNEINGEGQ